MKTLRRSLLFALLLLLGCVCTLDANAESQMPLKAPETTASRNVAIIGAGSAGSSTAYYLKKFAELSGIALNITVFERKAYIGGRSTTVDVFGDPSLPIELGASIFVSVNHNLMDAARELKLEISNAGGDRSPDSNNMLGIWDGTGFVYLQGHSLSWWDTVKLLWRYGLAPIRTQNLMKKTVNRFLEMYKPPYFPFKLLTSVVQDLDLHKATAVTGSQFLAANGISDTFANEIIQSSTRVNYGQNLALIHGLETMVCMATDGAVAIENGNWRIFAGMLDMSRADVKLNSTVTSLEQRHDDTVVLSYFSNGGSAVTQVFDEVVIAAPFQYSGIELSSSIEQIPDKIPYVKLYVTLFASPHRLSSQKFNVPNPSDVPDMILTTLPRGLDLGSREDGVGPAGFWSISLLRTVPAPAEYSHQQHYVYKVFSPERLTAGFLASILDIELPNSQGNATVEALSTKDISWVHEKTWRSYPYGYPRHTFENIRLASNVWYTAGIESFISTMETSSLMGMNVAALMSDEWHDKWQQGKPVSWIDWAAQRSHEV